MFFVFQAVPVDQVAHADQLLHGLPAQAHDHAGHAAPHDQPDHQVQGEPATTDVVHQKVFVDQSKTIAPPHQPHPQPQPHPPPHPPQPLCHQYKDVQAQPFHPLPQFHQLVADQTQEIDQEPENVYAYSIMFHHFKEVQAVHHAQPQPHDHVSGQTTQLLE